MSSGSGPPDNLVTSASELILPMSIEEECINLLDEQLNTLRFNAVISRFETLIDESGKVRVYEFIQVKKQGDEVAKRFLIDVIKLDLRIYDESRGNTLIVICNAFISKFGNDIYIYLIYIQKPSLLFEIIARKQVKNFRNRRIKFIERRDICDVKRIFDSGLHKNYLQEVKDHLNDLLDLEEAQLESQIPSEGMTGRLQRISNPSEITRTERRRLIKIIQEMTRFEKGNRRSFVNYFLGIKVDNSFPYDGDGNLAASELVGKTLDSLDEFMNLLEGLLETGDIQDSEDRKDKSFLEELRERCSGE